MESVETEGRNSSEAIEQALATLNLRRDQVRIEILSEGRPRLLGFRGEPARVRVTPLPQPTAPVAPLAGRGAPGQAADEEDRDEDDEDEEYDEEEEDEEEGEDEEDEEEPQPPIETRRREPVEARQPIPIDSDDARLAVEILEGLLQRMGIDATVSARQPETAGDGIGMIEAVLDIDGEDLGLLIGRRGQTLASLQYILNLMVSKKAGHRVSLGIDVDGYRRRREEVLVSLAMRSAARVRSSGRSVTLEPMPPNERRIIHITLAEDPNVMTVSIGEGEARKVAITPTG